MKITKESMHSKDAYYVFIKDVIVVFNCSQTNFVVILLVMSVFFYAIFCVTDFSSEAFHFSSSKLVAPSGH